MKRAFVFFTVVLLVPAFNLFSEEEVAVKDLPPAVQKTVRNLTGDAELKGLSKEMEERGTVYEAETIRNGRSRDVLIAASGAILEVEEGTTLDEIPGPAKAAIEKAAAGGKVIKVEAVTRAGVTTYEAAVRKAGKAAEINVKANGSIVK